MVKSPAAKGPSPSQLISKRIAELGDWRGKTLARMRKLIREADPAVVEEWKWVKPKHPGTPVWSHDGIICTGESYKKVVKLTFARGASLDDPSGLFNASLEGSTRRAIDIPEGEEVDATAFKALIRQAVALNTSKPSSSKKVAKKATARRVAAKPRLLSGGNPQIAKADGNAPVQAYIAAMPGWKSEVGRRIDAVITRAAPGVRKAVKWNSPFYGVDGQGWFLNFHTFARYVKVAFFRGASLRPPPPGASKHKEVRYLDIHQGELDEAQLRAWVRQAAALPGWTP